MSKAKKPKKPKPAEHYPANEETVEHNDESFRIWQNGVDFWMCHMDGYGEEFSCVDREQAIRRGRNFLDELAEE